MMWTIRLGIGMLALAAASLAGAASSRATPASAAGAAQAGAARTQQSDADKLRALEQACQAGVLTPQECETKRKALTKHAPSAAERKKLAALEQACKAGVFSPEECAAKRRAILGDAADNDGQPAPAPAPAPEGNSGELSGSVYRDPQHRFSLQVPAGWSVGPSGDSIQIKRGGATVVVGPFGGVRTGRDAVANLVNQFMNQFQNMKELNHGDKTLAGANASYAMFGGINQRGVPTLLRFVGVDAPGEPIAIIILAPQQEVQESEELKGGLVQIENTFALGDTPNASGGDAPAGGPVDGMSGGPGPGGGPARNPNRVSLGVAVNQITPEQAQQMGLKDNRGALIAQVVPGGAAERAGIQPGDFVVAMNRTSVESAQDLVRLLGQRNPGDTLEIIALRGGKPKVFQATLAPAGQ